MTAVLALDPAIRSPGVAAFVDGTLVAAANVKVPARVHKLADGDRVQIVSVLISDWWRAVDVLRDFSIVYEWPQIYGPGKGKGDPNDLLKVLAVGAAVAARLSRASEVVTPRPREWAGQTSKETDGTAWDSERGQLIARRLTPTELALVPAQHDAIDAVGLGLWKLGRLERIAVHAGASSDPARSEQARACAAAALAAARARRSRRRARGA